MKDVAVQHLLKWQQFGVSVPCGAEAIVNAVRLYLDQVDDDPAADPAEMAEPLLRCLLKTDMRNAFGCISRSRMLHAVVETLPGLARFVHMAYSKPGRVTLVNRRAGEGEERFKTFLSKTGVRQGDPLGPLLYALTAVTAMREVHQYSGGSRLRNPRIKKLPSLRRGAPKQK